MIIISTEKKQEEKTDANENLVTATVSNATKAERYVKTPLKKALRLLVSW